LAKSFWDKRRKRESDNEAGRYRPAPHAHSDSMSEDTISRVEEGRPAAGTPGPYLHPGRRQSYSSMDYSYYTHPEQDQGHGVRNAILGAGAFAAVKNLFKRRKDDDEQRRIEDIKRRDREEEKVARANSQRKQSGDGFVPRRQKPSQSVLSSEMTSDITPRPPRPDNRTQEAMVSGGVRDDTSTIPPAPPQHGQAPESVFDSDLESAVTGAAAGAAVGSASRRRSSSRRRHDGVSSPPVSVKVKMHNDGRHVTLRRLTEEEAAANRQAKRHSRERHSSRRRGSASSLSGNEGGSDRWRRVEEMERRQAEQTQREQAAALAAESAATASVAPISPPPAPLAPPPMSHAATSQTSVPPAPSNMQYPPTASLTSPGTWTGTEASADYANNRRRRRAERAQARARQQAQHSVEFT
jgi:hypothetical protein